MMPMGGMTTLHCCMSVLERATQELVCLTVLQSRCCHGYETHVVENKTTNVDSNQGCGVVTKHRGFRTRALAVIVPQEIENETVNVG